MTLPLVLLIKATASSNVGPIRLAAAIIALASTAKTAFPSANNSVSFLSIISLYLLISSYLSKFKRLQHKITMKIKTD